MAPVGTAPRKWTVTEEILICLHQTTVNTLYISQTCRVSSYALVPEPLWTNQHPATASVLSELSLIERRAKSSTEGFSQWKRSFHSSLNWQFTYTVHSHIQCLVWNKQVLGPSAVCLCMCEHSNQTQVWTKTASGTVLFGKLWSDLDLPYSKRIRHFWTKPAPVLLRAL